MSVTLTNAGTRKRDALHAHLGYTITAVVKELPERAEQRVTARLPPRAHRPE
jgi:hypothetical protein